MFRRSPGFSRYFTVLREHNFISAPSGQPQPGKYGRGDDRPEPKLPHLFVTFWWVLGCSQ